jgi:hypothetical protein
MTARSLLRLALAFLTAGLLSAQATVFHGPAGGPGDVWVHSAPKTPGTRPPELQGIVLLPIDAAGRTDFTQFLPDQPRLRQDVPFASRLILPQGQGSLYRYRKSTPAGADFGFFIVRPDGMAAFLAAFPGSGATGTNDPIPSPVAIAGQGDGMLVATTVAAGGDVFLIEFGSAQARNLTAGMARSERDATGSDPPADLGFRPDRSRAPALPAQRRSDDRRAARVAHGREHDRPQSRRARRGHALLLRPGHGQEARRQHGRAHRRHGQRPRPRVHSRQHGTLGVRERRPAPIANPGFGTFDGPTLALSPDGKRAAWKTMVQTPTVTGECFSRKVPVQPTPPELQITADQNFTNTLNDTGVIAFFDPNSVVLIVGEFNGVLGIEKADVFRATFPIGAGAPQFTNLTNSSGDTTVPFLSKGDLNTADGIYQLPGGAGSVYFVSGSSGQGELRRLNTAAASSQLIRSGVAALDFVERAGSDFVLGIEHDQPAQRELLRVPFDLGQPAASLGLFSLTQPLFAHKRQRERPASPSRSS